MPLCFIVEDHGDTREGYAEYLGWSGVEVRSANGAEELRKLLETDIPDVVVMDLRLPSVDGWTLTRELKEDPRTAGTVVIVVSASVLPEDVTRALEAGGDIFLPKPCDPARLLTELQRLLDLPSTEARRK